MDSAASTPLGSLESAPTKPGRDFLVLGPVEVRRDGVTVSVGGPKQRSIIAMLIAHIGRPVSLDRIVEAVYGEEAPSGARHSVQTYVSTLRHDLGDVVRKDAGGYVLSVDSGTIDFVRFETAVHTALAILEQEPETASTALREALAMWRGHAYADVDGRGFLEAEITRLSQLRLSALEARIDADLALGRHRALLGELDSLTVEHPLAERFRAQQMLALYRCGRQTEALRAYAQTRLYLADEIGIDPSPELSLLEQRILDHDPDLDLAAAPSLTRRAVLVVDMAVGQTLTQMGPSSREALVETLANTFQSAVGRHRGEWLSQRGSALYAAFHSVGEAVSTASEVATSVYPSPVRIAVDYGDVEVHESGEVRGPPVRRSAGIVATAHGGQVLLSSGAHASLLEEGQSGWLLRSLGQHPIHGIDGPQQVFQLVLDGQEKEFPPLLLDNTPPPMPMEQGAVGGYELRRQITSDISGTTYRAYQPSVGREVVVRVIDPVWANEPGFISRFEVEAQMVTRLQHPHIVPVLDYWRDPTGAYLVAPPVGAITLTQTLQERALDPSKRRWLVNQLGAALSYAHQLGIVHGAISPSAVVVDESGNAYLTGVEFVMRLVAAPRSASRYSPPEQVQGEPITVATDIYGLGLLTLDLLAEETGDGLRALVARATASEPADRFHSVDEFLAELGSVLGETDRAEPFTATRNPYRGLEAFGEADAADFYGRSQAVDELVAFLGRQRLVAVVGPSGCGKSSLVEAGLIPAVRAGAVDPSQRWLVTTMFPGSYPFAELESALARVAVEDPGSVMDEIDRDERGVVRAIKRILPTDARLLLIIDQFEELFTLTRDEETRDRFMRALVALAEDERSNVRLVVTLRADFFDRPLQYPAFGELLKAGTFTLTTPIPALLTEAIARPAENVGVTWEPGVVEQIVEDVTDSPGTLPLLQYTLTEVFDARGSDVLTHQDYRAVGGVLGALGTRADEVYDGLDPFHQTITRQLFLRMVSVQASGDQTRRRARHSDLDQMGEPAQIEAVLNAFGNARLLTFDHDPVTRGPTVEVAHEALLSRWPRLAVWITETREDLLLRQRLGDAVDEWDRSHHDDAYLLTGGRLAQFQSWAANSDLALDATESEYLALSGAREDRERVRRRRLRNLVTSGFAAVALVATVLGVLALISRQEANANANLAHSRELAASAVNTLGDDPELSLLLAIEAANRSDPTVETLSVMHEALSAHRKILTYRWPSDEDLAQDLSTRLSPDGRFMVASSGGTFIEVIDVESGERLWGKNFGGEGVSRAIFNHDGSQVVATYGWFSPSGAGVIDAATESQLGVHVLDAATGETIHHHLIGPRCGVVSRPQALWAAGDGTDSLLVAELGSDANCDYRGERRESNNPEDRREPPPVLVDLGTGEVTQLSDLRPWAGEPPTAVLSGDGRYLLVAEASSGTDLSNVIDRTTGEEIAEVQGLPLGLNIDGSMALTMAWPELLTWDLNSGQPDGPAMTRELRVTGGPLDGLAYPWLSPAGDMVAESIDSSVSLRDPRTGEEVDRLLTGLGSDGHVSFSANASRIAVPEAFGATAVIFDLEVPIEVASIKVCDEFLNRTGSVLVGGGTFSVRASCPGVGYLSEFILDAGSGEVRTTFSPSGGVGSTLSADGRVFAGQRVTPAGVHGEIELYDTTTGEVLGTLKGLCDHIGGSGNGCEEFPNTPFPDWPWDLDFSPDESLLAMAGNYTDAVTVWDVDSGEIVASPVLPHNTDGPDRALDVEFSPDGAALAASFVWAPQELWLLSTEDWAPIVQYRSPEGAGNVETPSANLVFTPDGSTLIATDYADIGQARIVFMNGSTLEHQAEITNAHDGGITELALNEDGSLLASAGLDGFVRVWDVDSFALVHQIPVSRDGAGVGGVAFVDGGRHIAVSIPATGELRVITVDTEELLDMARSRLTRGFSQTECTTYRIDPCPTLEELRAG